jgi:hypothetical protein
MAVALGFASPARAALLTITDTFGGSNTVWTLDVTGGCTTCTVTLTANFQDPDGAGAGTNAYTGTFIDSVQWTIAGTDISTINDANGGSPGNVGSTALDATTTSWTAAEGSLNANQCSGGAADNVCAASNDTLGFGPIVNGSTLTWTFNVTFASALPSNLTGVEGNIRGAFNNADGSNKNIFSPEGGTFGGTGTGAGGGTGQPLVPEPTSLLLFGSGLTMAAYRARRARKQNQKKD